MKNIFIFELYLIFHKMEEKPIGYLHMKFTAHGKFLQKTLKLLLKLFKLRCFGIIFLYGCRLQKTLEDAD